MSEAMQKRAQEISHEITKCKVKMLHDWYIESLISYWDYKERLFKIVNGIRQNGRNEPFSKKKFDEAWQYRNMAHEDWKTARNEILNTVLGWW